MSVSTRNAMALLGFLAAVFAVSVIGAAATATSVNSWYASLVKPPFNPPNWLFGPVWTVLYIIIALAAWRIWRSPENPARRLGLVLFAIQLALNLLWSILFFGLQQPGIALAEIGVLLAFIAATGHFFLRVDRLAGLMFLPYLLWVAFAAVLNLSIWMLN